MQTDKRKKKLEVDLWIITIVTVLILVVYSVWNKSINEIVYNSSINIVLRVLFIGGIFQFGLAGLGITIVSIFRKESFLSHGLTLKNILPAILLSTLCCVPDFIHNFIIGNVDVWLPFYDVNTTAEVLNSGFPTNVFGMVITAVCWGFFEGFNYVVISDKISERNPSKNKFWDWGAFVCAVMCIVIHGAVGITPKEIIDMFCTMILIYGMLIVRKTTGNAWGCVLIFILYWNAL
jgi:hypothetical protein